MEKEEVLNKYFWSIFGRGRVTYLLSFPTVTRKVVSTATIKIKHFYIRRTVNGHHRVLNYLKSTLSH